MLHPIKPWLALAGWLLLCFSAAAFGAQFMPGAWYASLRKPDWNPPSWVFGPVWTVLYAMMAVAAWRVGRRSGAGRGPALAWFLGQLLLNALWSWLFFGLRNPGLALAEILALWVAIVGTIAGFRGLDRVAAWLLAPYLAWVSFAAVLNGALWWLNR
jgi:tryptophan-rich sensory protein